jgi:hypothetical protein
MIDAAKLRAEIERAKDHQVACFEHGDSVKDIRRLVAWSIVGACAAPFVFILMRTVWLDYCHDPQGALIGIGLTVAGFPLWWAVVELMGKKNERI